MPQGTLVSLPSRRTDITQTQPRHISCMLSLCPKLRCFDDRAWNMWTDMSSRGVQGRSSKTYCTPYKDLPELILILAFGALDLKQELLRVASEEICQTTGIPSFRLGSAGHLGNPKFRTVSTCPGTGCVLRFRPSKQLYRRDLENPFSLVGASRDRDIRQRAARVSKAAMHVHAT